MLHNAQVVGFAEGTPVLMADGKWKPIEEINQGDWVMSFDPSLENSQLEPRKVVDTYATLHRDCIEVHANGKITIVAKDQLFFTPGAGWLPGYDTKQVINFAGQHQEIQVRRVRGGKFKVFDITVDETHALVANDLRVHNRKKKKVQAPQPVVTAGKPGKPISVTTTYNGNTTTVVVNPSPGSSGQISVGASGTIGISQNSIPGLPISDSTDYMPYKILPYPGGSYVYDRALNAQNTRTNVCNAMLNKGNNYRVTKKDEASWEAQLDNLIAELSSIKGVNIHMGPTRIKISSDPTIINDAINNAKALKTEIKAGRKLTTGIIRQNCENLSNLINRLADASVPRYHSNNNPPIISNEPPKVIVCPGPENYHSERIYDSYASYEYIGKFDGCQYIFDPPNAPAVTEVRYYKHYDPVASKYYFDRISSGAIC